MSERTYGGKTFVELREFSDTFQDLLGRWNGMTDADRFTPHGRGTQDTVRTNARHVGRLARMALPDLLDRVEELEEKEADLVKFTTGILSGGCDADHSDAPMEDFRGCVVCLKRRVEQLEGALRLAEAELFPNHEGQEVDYIAAGNIIREALDA